MCLRLMKHGKDYLNNNEQDHDKIESEVLESVPHLWILSITGSLLVRGCGDDACFSDLNKP